MLHDIVLAADHPFRPSTSGTALRVSARPGLADSLHYPEVKHVPATDDLDAALLVLRGEADCCLTRIELLEWANAISHTNTVWLVSSNIAAGGFPGFGHSKAPD